MIQLTLTSITYLISGWFFLFRFVQHFPTILVERDFSTDDHWIALWRSRTESHHGDPFDTTGCKSFQNITTSGKWCGAEPWTSKHNLSYNPFYYFLIVCWFKMTCVVDFYAPTTQRDATYIFDFAVLSVCPHIPEYCTLWGFVR